MSTGRKVRGEADLPALLSWSPYGKHAQSNQVFWPRSGVNPEWLSPLTPFEGADPVKWGAWLCRGRRRSARRMAVRRRFPPQRRGRGQDCADTINWLADQPWSNGKVGMTGVSYLAAIQFWVAALNPPALAAINRGKASPTGIANSPITAASRNRVPAARPTTSVSR
jgi:predicted acyl esterase